MYRRLFFAMIGGVPLLGLPAVAQSETDAAAVTPGASVPAATEAAPAAVPAAVAAPGTAVPDAAKPETAALPAAGAAAAEPAEVKPAEAVPAEAKPAEAKPALTRASAPAKPATRPIEDPAPRSSWPIAQRYYPTEVSVRPDLEVGSIIIVSDKFFLYHIIAPGKAMRYGVAVGRDELKFRGTAVVARKVRWPTWTPTPDMIKRNPNAYEKYKEGMPGGLTNPLGARAMYLYQDGKDTAIRIHGTTEPSSIGHAVSNGCLRMVNDHVIALFDQVPVGTRVTVY